MKLLDFSQYLVYLSHLCMFCTVYLLSLMAAISAQPFTTCMSFLHVYMPLVF